MPGLTVAFHADQLWFSTPGGIGTYVRELCSALGDQDPSVRIVPFRARYRHPAQFSVPWQPVELRSSIRTLYPAWDLLGLPRLPASLAVADIVHATNHVAVPPAGRKQRLVVTVHDLAFDRFPQAFPARWRWLYRAGLRAAIRRADALIVPSVSTADDLAGRDVDPAKIHVTPLASSLVLGDRDPAEVSARLGVPVPFLLFVGTLEPRKNLVRLARAYRRAVTSADLPHALVLAGPIGWDMGELTRVLATPGPGRIVATGSLPAEDLDALYRAAGGFAYPSLYEGFGLPVLEAMSRGVPTMASNTSALPETAGDAALLVDPTDETAIAEALVRLLTDEALAGDLRRRGSERASKFSWPATARATLKVYRHVAGARR